MMASSNYTHIFLKKVTYLACHRPAKTSPPPSSQRGAVEASVRSRRWGFSISQNGGYVDNPCSTPYPPRETVAYGKGERYGGACCHPSTPGIPAAQSIALF